jgi:CheY-like chemotaxis protein
MGKRVLFADDNETFLYLAYQYCNHRSLDITLSRNGREALEYLKHYRYSLLVSDLDMPVMDGRTLLTAVKTEYRSTKVMIVTGRPDPRRELLVRGALDVLEKPVAMGHLAAVIDQVLHHENRRATRFPCRIPIRLNGALSGEARNISADGVLAQTDQAPALSGNCTVELSLPGMPGPLSVTGSMVRTGRADSRHYTAFYFARALGTELYTGAMFGLE